jgi:DNA-binding Lrp family transcriptional regulator
MPSLDAIDVKILDLLQTDASQPISEIADRVHLSQNACWRRIKLLEEAGIITKRVALLDAEKLGYGIVIWAMISLSLHQDRPIDAFRKGIEDIPEVVECYNISGEHDFLLKILVEDIRGYQLLMHDRLSRIEGVRQLQSSFVLGTTKQTTHIPL